MSQPRRSLLPSAGLILGLTPLLFGEVPADDEDSVIASRPAGALHRLGTIRLCARGSILGVAFSPDGKRLAASIGKAALPVWELRRGRLSYFMPETHHSIGCVAFSPDGLIVAAGDSDATVHLRDAKSGLPDRERHGHGGTVTAVAFSPDGRTLASASEDHTAIVWNVSGRLLRRLEGHRQKVLSLVFSSDGKRLATGGRDGTIRLWDAATWTGRRRWTTGGASVTALVFAPDSQSILAEGGDHAIRQWDVATARETRSFRGHRDHVLALALTRDGKTLASSSADGTIRLWKTADGTLLRRVVMRKTAAAALAFSPDDKMLAVCNQDCLIDLLPLVTGANSNDFVGHRSAVHSIVVSADGREATMRVERETLRWELKTGALLEEIEEKPASGSRKRIEAHSPDGKIQAREARKAGDMVCTEVLSGRPICELRGHLGSITCLTFAADGRTLLSGSDDSRVVVWDLIASCAPPDPKWKPEEKDLKRLWAFLGGESAARAFNYLHVFARNSKLAIPFVRRQVPVPRDDRRVRQLVTDLDSDTFTVREKASAELTKMGASVDFVLRQALREKPSLEVRRRIEDVLTGSEADVVATRRWSRVVLLLEWDGSPQAHDVLEALAKSSVSAAVVRDARAALARLDKRTKKR